MIALREEMPLVMTSFGQTAFFNRGWITHSLLEAARSAGREYWSLSQEISNALTTYLQEEFEGTVIELRELEQIIKRLLLSLDYHDIATYFYLTDPPIQISLLDLVREAGEGYELAFFQLLGKRLKKIAQSSSQRLEIVDLKPSLRLLKHRLRLRQSDSLHDEIVTYVRRWSSSSLLSTQNKKKQLEIELS